MCRSRPLSRFLAVTGLLLAAASAPLAPAAAQELAGNYVLLADQSDDVARVIEKGTAGMNFLFRPIARSRLKKTNQPYLTVEIQRTDSTYGIGSDGDDPVVTPASGEVIKWRRKDGEVFDVNTVETEGGVRQTFTADDGSRENFWLPQADGGLELQVTIRSGKLPEPIRYRMIYRRS